MVRSRLTLGLALLALGVAPAASASAATSGGAGDPSSLVHGSPTSGGVTATAPRPKPKPKPRPKPRPRPRPRPRPKPRPPVTTGVFPVRGAHSFGGSGARFGAGRPGHIHQGQDVVAAAGTRLVSPARGTVYYRAYQAGGAGNYVVIRGADRRYYVFMHLQRPSSVAPGAAVRAGQTVGAVGSTGDSSGPHLHFEIWVGGAWQAGGHPVDPLPYLKRWR